MNGNPQIENGFVRIATELQVALCKISCGGVERQVYDCILLKTYGWHKKSDKISLSQFVKMTNASKRSIIYAIQNLSAKNMIHVAKGDMIKGNEYRINKHYKEWKVQNCALQVEKNRKRAKERSAKLCTGAKLGKKVVQNSVKGERSFAHTKDTLTKDNTKDIHSDFAKSGKRTLQKHLYPLAIFTLAKAITFDNDKKVQHHIRRFGKESSSMSGYNPEQVLRAFFRAVDEAKDKKYDVQLETVGKKIAEYHDMVIPQKYQESFQRILAEFEKNKDSILTPSNATP